MNELTASITVRCLATSPGKVTITVRDATPSEDLKSTDSRPANLVFTTYVVKAPLAVGVSDTVRLLGVTNGVGYPYDHLNDVQIYRGDGRNNRVSYQTAGTAGTLYIKEGNRAGRFTAAGTALETSSSAPVYLSLGAKTTLDGRPTSGSTNTVTVSVSDNATDPTTGVYIYRRPQLSDPTEATELDAGRAGLLVSNAIAVTVTDGGGQNVGGVPVTFKVANTTSQGGLLRYTSATTDTQKIDANNKVLENPPAAARTLYVRTAANGQAIVDFEFGSAGGEQEITVTAVGTTKTVKAVDTATSTRDISIESEKRSNSNIYDIYATVTDNGIETSGVQVTFTAISGGQLTNTPTGTGDPTTADSVSDLTNPLGIAQVIYDPQGVSGTLQLSVSLKETGAPGDTDAKTIRRTFDVRGGASPPPPPPDDDDEEDEEDEEDTAPTGNTISVSTSSLTGGTGEVVELRVLAGTAVVTVTGDSTFILQGGLVSGTGVTRNITLPTTEGFYSLTVSAPNYDTETVLVTVSGAPAGPGSAVTGTLSITLVGARSGDQQAIQVTAQPSPSSDLIVTLSGATNPPTLTISAGESSDTRVATLPTTTGAHTLRVSADGYNPGSVTVPAVSGQQPVTSGPAGEPDSIEIDGSRQLSGTVNQNMPLRVRVTDANGNGVSDVRTTFRVLAPGRGRLSQRGNGRAVAVNTDRNGYANASLTPLGGNLIVEAGAAGVTARVSFIINVGEAPDTGTDTSAPGPGVTPSREINPDVQVGKASRPPMVWVDSGGIYALVGSDVERFAPSVDNALNIAVGGNKVYWTEMTGESRGTINSAKLDGSDVKELKAIKAVPMGIAVDTAADKLYWTNSRGKIQSANLNGKKIEDVREDLPGPMDIAVARGILYWTQYDEAEGEGKVGIVNPARAGTPTVYISTGSDMPGSVVTAGNKVYWTEMTGSNSGTINSANLNGTRPTELNDIRAVPMGIAVDTARSKLYWTNSRGRVQSANLDGRKIQNVVEGLGNPGDMVLSNSIEAPVAGGTSSSSGSGTTASNKYDINGDGSVDSMDVDALIVAVAAGVTDAKYDVNGDGKVDIFDVSAVSTNRGEGAASAPALLGTKLSIVQIDRLQEQIDLLIASNDRSPDTMRLLIYLQQLIVMARPEKTQLLANYPNPFNPETWIPYELATDTSVKITIYNTQGVVIRTLELGHQAAGYYTGRDRAAYWDGRNAFGEQVASGVYFYQFETDDMSSMRKMVILK